MIALLISTLSGVLVSYISQDWIMGVLVAGLVAAVCHYASQYHNAKIETMVNCTNAIIKAILEEQK